ncbi:hypothetical protein J6590_028812 [Homalodisca vitripennis]|nr:hypothetical protein J6590_028812 [Homalodisca vitripennis]
MYSVEFTVQVFFVVTPVLKYQQINIRPGNISLSRGGGGLGAEPVSGVVSFGSSSSKIHDVIEDLRNCPTIRNLHVRGVSLSESIKMAQLSPEVAVICDVLLVLFDWSAELARHWPRARSPRWRCGGRNAYYVRQIIGGQTLISLLGFWFGPPAKTVITHPKCGLPETGWEKRIAVQKIKTYWPPNSINSDLVPGRPTLPDVGNVPIENALGHQCGLCRHPALQPKYHPLINSIRSHERCRPLNYIQSRVHSSRALNHFSSADIKGGNTGLLPIGYVLTGRCDCVIRSDVPDTVYRVRSLQSVLYPRARVLVALPWNEKQFYTDEEIDTSAIMLDINHPFPFPHHPSPPSVIMMLARWNIRTKQSFARETGPIIDHCRSPEANGHGQNERKRNHHVVQELETKVSPKSLFPCNNDNVAACLPRCGKVYNGHIRPINVAIFGYSRVRGLSIDTDSLLRALVH